MESTALTLGSACREYQERTWRLLSDLDLR
jgi:hypothetical protein